MTREQLIEEIEEKLPYLGAVTLALIAELIRLQA